MTKKYKGDLFKEKQDGLEPIGVLGDDGKIYPIPYDLGTNTIRTSAGVSTIGDVVLRDSIDSTRKAEVTAAREVSVRVANPTANPETGLAKETSLVTLRDKDFATQTTLAAVLVELEQKTEPNQVQTIAGAVVPDRPSQKIGRVHKHITAENLTASTNLYEVPSGKVLYVTSALIQIRNISATVAGTGRINAGTTIKIPIFAGIMSPGQNAPATFLAAVFPEPIQFPAAGVNSVNWEEVTGDPIVTLTLVGYEE